MENELEDARHLLPMSLLEDLGMLDGHNDGEDNNDDNHTNHNGSKLATAAAAEDAKKKRAMIFAWVDKRVPFKHLQRALERVGQLLSITAGCSGRHRFAYARYCC